MVFAHIGRDVEICAQESGPQFGDQLLGGIRVAAKAAFESNLDGARFRRLFFYTRHTTTISTVDIPMKCVCFQQISTAPGYPPLARHSRRPSPY